MHSRTNPLTGEFSMWCPPFVRMTMIWFLGMVISVSMVHPTFAAEDAEAARADAKLAIAKVGAVTEVDGVVVEAILVGPRATDDVVAKLKLFPELEVLDLEDARISDEGMAVLAQLKKLKSLYLVGTAITGEGLKHVAGLTELVDLNLTGCRGLNSESMVHLSQLKKLETLQLADNKGITDESLPHFKELKNLRSLSFENTRITGGKFSELSELKRLQSLNLYHTALNDAGLKGLSQFGSLQQLNLGFCYRITDAGLAHLKKLEDLRNLDLTGCLLISDKGAEHLEELRKLEELDLRRTRVSGKAVEALKETLPKAKILVLQSPIGLAEAGKNPQLEVRIEVDRALDNATKARLIEEFQEATDEPASASYSVYDSNGKTVFVISPVIHFGTFLESARSGKVVARHADRRQIQFEVSEMPKASSQPSP